MKWKVTDHWELGYDLTCPNCQYTIIVRDPNDKNIPEECPKCKEKMEK